MDHILALCALLSADDDYTMSNCSVGKNSSITRINEKLLAFENWSAQDIERRQDMLIALGKDVWRTTPIDVS